MGGAIVNFEIFYAIVGLYSVLVMNDFSRKKVTLKAFFHHKAMLIDGFVCCLGMVGSIYQNVSFAMKAFSAFPAGCFFSSSQRGMARVRAALNSLKPCFESFFATPASLYKWHARYHIKKTGFVNAYSLN